MAAAGAIAWSVLDKPTLDEQVVALGAVDNADIDDGPSFVKHLTAPVAGGDFAALTALYSDESASERKRND